MNVNEINAGIATLRSSEASSKDLIGKLAFACMDRIHENHDVDSASRFLVALSPLNQKKVSSFFDKFSGHKLEDGVIGKRKKERTVNGTTTDGYVVALDAWRKFKESGLTFWQWAVTTKKAAAHTVDMEFISKAAKKARKAAEEGIKAGVITPFQAFGELTGGVFSPSDMLMILKEMVKIEEQATKEAHDAANGVTLTGIPAHLMQAPAAALM